MSAKIDALIVAGALVSLALAGCAAPMPSTPAPEPTFTMPEMPDIDDIPIPTPSTPDAEPSTEGIFSLSVGDCFDDEGDVLVDDVPKIDCAAPHDLEVFDQFDITAVTFDAGAVAEEAQNGCKDRFAAFLGLSYDESTLDLLDFHPTANSWTFGDRRVSCAMGVPDEKTTGSLRGAAR